MRKPLIAVLMTSAFFSLNTQAADLIQVYQQALANDAQYASARAALSAGMERVPQGLSGLLPQISASGTNTRGNQEPIALINGNKITMPTVSVHTNTYNLTLAQPLFRWDRWETYQQSKLAQAIAEAQFAQVQQDLITRVAQAYFDVLSAQDNLGATQAQKVATTEQLASAKRNFEVGTQTITDTHEAQAAYDLVVAQEFAAINDLANKRSALQTIIGEAPTALAPMRTGVVISAPEPAAIEPWVSSAEEQNYGVVTAQFNVESAKRDIGRNRAGHYPTLDLIANTGHTYTTGGGGGANNNAIGVQWSIPIFSGFAVTSKVRESIALENKARNDLETARRTASQGARQAFLGVNSGLAQVKALEAAEVSSKSALESNQLGYQVGVRINIDVLNAQKQLFSTQKDLSKARYDTIMNGLRLKSAAGTLKETDLLPVNALLDK
ncbi:MULTISPECIES: TolC family outer membrane protein [unclassified Janthinobacterium]|uniref:TolC family outer membrane protein n=1 Tax=unclassified Janthinobacterium TaxID=2610881 RepID=UPI0008F4F741|nr:MULTISPECIES: TolC family outer membrane protein [unclassified Janthinobacterium]APA66643.1 channel protein TolC [Janthinobacterium sp. 1_2014MBL_MicDiv]MDN2707992.1 TolC family outer membrane protein [Janthinobacterium sp. SUN118]